MIIGTIVIFSNNCYSSNVLRNLFAHYLEVLVPIYLPVPHQHVYKVDNYAGQRSLGKARQLG